MAVPLYKQFLDPFEHELPSPNPNLPNPENLVPPKPSTMTPSAPAETNPCPDLMHNNIHSHPSSFKKYLYESILKGRESSHTHAIGFKLTGIEETLRKEIEVIKLYLGELEVARAYIKDNMTHSPSPLPQTSKPWSNLPVEVRDRASRSCSFVGATVVGTVDGVHRWVACSFAPVSSVRPNSSPEPFQRRAEP